MQVTEPQVTVETAKSLGLTEKEFEKITVILDRTPNFTELSIFSVMWSEHYSYKKPLKWLRTLPREGKRLFVDADEENAGLVDIGNGLACAFKIDSHNHSSTIEPFQGATAGAGGIHNNIFSVGARPIAALNSLCFGDIHLKHTKRLLKEVVSSIGNYANSFGLPLVGGEVHFNECYNQNTLVNTLSVGIAELGKTVSAVANGPGNPVLVVGSAIGKDNLPAVRAGDPIQEKSLLEATFEAINTGAIVGMQDMGAAGIIGSTSEMSAKSGTGMRIDLDKVPIRQASMRPYEILLSASRERMLLVCQEGKEDLLFEVFEKWDLECGQIGEVTDTAHLEFYAQGELIADVPSKALVLGGSAPVYERAYKKPAYLEILKKFKEKQIPKPKDYLAIAKKLYKSPNLISKYWVYKQFESEGRNNFIETSTPSDASLVSLKGMDKALAVTLACNSTYVFADPYIGAMIAVATAARNIVCSGGTPLAVTKCLNFGNPNDPEVYWQFVNAIKGMGDACRKFDTPVKSGNISFCNPSVFEDKTEPVFPTPTIGMLGVLDDLSLHTRLDFKEAGDQIYMIGTPRNDLGSSEYLRCIHNIKYSSGPYFDLDEEFNIQESLKALIQKKLVSSAHGISGGGLFAALVESALVNGLGFDIETDPNFRKDAYLFGESQSRIIISIKESREDEVVNFLNSHNISFSKLGEVTAGDLVIDEESFGSINSWKYIFENQLHEIMEEGS